MFRIRKIMVRGGVGGKGKVSPAWVSIKKTIVPAAEDWLFFSFLNGYNTFREISDRFCNFKYKMLVVKPFMV